MAEAVRMNTADPATADHFSAFAAEIRAMLAPLDLQGEWEKMKAEGEKRLQAAADQAEAMVAEAKAAADKLIADATETASKSVADAQAQADTISSMAAAEATKLVDDAKAKAAEIAEPK